MNDLFCVTSTGGVCIIVLCSDILVLSYLCQKTKNTQQTDFNSVRANMGIVLFVLLLLVVVVVVTQMEMNRILSDCGWGVTALIDSCACCEIDGGSEMGILIYFGINSITSLVLRCVGCEINGRIEIMKLSYLKMRHHYKWRNKEIGLESINFIM